MTKDKRGAQVRFLSIFTILYAIGKLAGIVIQCVQVVKETGSLLNIFMSFGAFELILTAFIALGLLATGAVIVDHYKKQSEIETIKDLSTIINSVIMISFVFTIAFEIYSIVFTLIMGGEIQFDLGLIYLVANIVCVSLVNITKLIKKGKLTSALLQILFAAIIAIGITGYELYVAIINEYEILNICVAIIKVLIMVFIFTYSSSSIKYYNKNPLFLDKAVFGNKEYDVIKKGAGFEVVKIYSHKVKEGAGQVFTKIIYVLAIAIFGCGIAFYAIENDISKYFVDGFSAFITKMINCFIGLQVDSGLQMVKDITVVFIQSLMLIGLLVSIFKRDAEGKANTKQVVNIGVTLALFSVLTIISKIAIELIYTQTFDIANYSIWELVFVGVYILNIIVSIVMTKTSKAILTGTSSGAPYASYSQAVTKATTVSGIFSIVFLGVCFLMGFLETGAIALSYPIMAGGILFIILAVALENKFPCSEFIILKHRVIEQSYQVENAEI